MKKKKSKRRLLLFIIILIIPLFFVATGLHYVPVNVSLGPCLMDYTSPQTYMGERPSPLQEVRFGMGEGDVLICYGSPSARDRQVFGGIVRYDRIWRFGANEPTRLYTSTDIKIGGIALPAGRYSLYAKPGEKEWEVFISTSTYHWGNMITQDVRNEEIGNITIPVDSTMRFVEAFTINVKETSGGSKQLIVEWEKTSLAIPISN